MLWLITKLVSFGVPEKLVRPLLYVLAALALLASCAALKSCYDNRIISKHDQAVTVKTLQQEKKADQADAQSQATDTIENEKKDTQRHDAIKKAPDSAPDAPSVALGCIRLRQSGYDITRLPACRGH